jgi:hypothetical protein
MDKNLKHAEVHRLASLELNLLNYSRSLPPTVLENARLDAGTPVYDPNGEVLFVRFPLLQNGVSSGYADVAAHTALGAPLLAVAPTAVWNEQAVLAQGREAFWEQARGKDKKGHQKPAYDEVRFVAYSFPKIALQFLREKKEVVMLECFTWIPVPPAAERPDRKKLEPANFERWSLLDEMDERRKEENQRKFEERVKRLHESELNPVTVGLISRALVEPLISIIRLTLTNEIHYSRRSTDHHVCYELRGQETNVWCVAASVQMLLDFYRYNYSQSKIAQQLGLGTLANPNGLPYARVGDVVTQLQVMSSNALTAKMLTSPVFYDFVSELDQNRPMISFIPGHSRTVAGFTESLFVLLGFGGFRGLLVYDPWPPNAGVITRWENFDTQIYQYAYSAQVTTI